MKRLASIVTVMSLLASQAFAQGPIMKSAERALQDQQEQPIARHTGPNHSLLWGGAGLVGAGATLAILATTVAKSEDCASLGILGSVCVEETNRGLAWSGAAVAVLGVVFMGMSFAEDVQVVHGGVTIRHRVDLPRTLTKRERKPE